MTPEQFADYLKEIIKIYRFQELKKGKYEFSIEFEIKKDENIFNGPTLFLL